MKPERKIPGFDPRRRVATAGLPAVPRHALGRRWRPEGATSRRRPRGWPYTVSSSGSPCQGLPMKTGFRPGGRAGLQNGHMRPAGWAHRAKISSAARSAAGGAPMGRPKVCHMRFVSPDMLPAHVPRHHWRPPGGSVPRHAVAGSGWGILGIFHSGLEAKLPPPWRHTHL